MAQSSLKIIGQRVAMLAVIFSSLHFVLNFTLGYLVSEIFSRGSGCVVTVERPQLRYFPVRGRVHDVVIRHPNESPSEGFKADSVSVELSVLALFSKKVVLDDLELKGSTLQSIGEDTGFIKVLEFLFKKRPKNKTTSKTWYSFIQTGWKVWVKRVVVSTKKNTENQLVLGTPGFQATLDSATFTSSDPGPGEPVLVELYGDNVRLKYQSSPELALGRIDSVGTLFNGVLALKKGVVTDDSTREAQNRTSRTEGYGFLDFRNEDRYHFYLDGDWFDHYLARVIYPAREHILATKPRMKFQVHIGGPLNQPEIGGRLSFGFDKGEGLFLREACAIKSLAAGFFATEKRLTLHDLAIEDVVKKGSLSLEFADPQPLEASLTVELSRDSNYLKRCIPERGPTDSHREQLEPFSLAVNQALADSLTEIQVKGSVADQVFNGKVLSEVYVNAPYAHSEFSADFQFAEQALRVDVSERGLIPQIESPAEVPVDAKQTGFTTEIRSNVKASLVYSLQNSELSVKDLLIDRYPADRFTARLAPFLSQEAFDSIVSSFSPTSLLSISGKADLDLKDFTGRGAGKISASEFELGVLRIDTLEMPVKFENGILSSPSVRLQTPGGLLTGSATLSTERVLNTQLSGTSLLPEALPTIEPYLDNLEADFDLSAEVSGELSELAVEADLLVRTKTIGSEGDPVQSRVSLSNAKGKLELVGDLLGGSGTIEASYPLRALDEVISLELRLKEFPIDYGWDISSPTSEDQDEIKGESEPLTDGRDISESKITAEISYRGTRSEPLLGKGGVIVTEIAWADRGLHIYQGNPLTASIQDGRLTFEHVQLELNKHLLKLDGYVDHIEGWNSSIRGGWELAPLSGLIPGIEQISGLLDMRLEITGSAFEPQAVGYMKLSNGSMSFQLGDSIFGFDRAQADLEFVKDRAVLRTFNAKMGDGILTGSGVIHDPLDRYQKDLALEFNISNGRVQPNQGLFVQFAGDLFLSKQGVSPFGLEGMLDVIQAKYEQRLTIAGMVKAMTEKIVGSDAAVVRRASGFQTDDKEFLTLDVRLSAKNGLVVETNLAKGELQGELHLKGNPQVPLLDGDIEVIDGSFDLGANEFDIVTGKVVFASQSHGLDPRLDFIAESQIEGVSGDAHQIRLMIGNTLSQPEVRFSSDSGLSEDEIVTLVGLGSGGLSLYILNKKRTFRELIDPRTDLSIRERIVGLAGFSDVQIESGVSETTGEPLAKLKAHRDFVGKSKLQLGTELAQDPTSTIGVEYPLTPYLHAFSRWSSRPVTEDSTDTSGAYGVGLRFRKSFSGLSLFPGEKSSMKVKSK